MRVGTSFAEEQGLNSDTPSGPKLASRVGPRRFPLLLLAELTENVARTDYTWRVVLRRCTTLGLWVPAAEVDPTAVRTALAGPQDLRTVQTARSALHIHRWHPAAVLPQLFPQLADTPPRRVR